MNKVQYIELLKLRGITELDGTSLAEAVRQSGGEPTTEEMVQVNKNSMTHYIGKFTEQKEINTKLQSIIDSQQEDVDFLRALEAAGVDNWEGYDIAQDYLEE